MSSISIGLSALQTAQQGLAIAGNNLANAATPGYHRQVAEASTLASTNVGGLSIGNGVGITTVNRAVSDQLDAALNQQTSLNGFTDASLNASTQIENTISSGVSSPATQLDALLSTIQALSANPTDGASRQAVVTSASTVASAFNAAASQLSQLQGGITASIQGDVGQINSISAQIAKLNGQIVSAQSQGISPNDLLDQRGQLVTSLSKLVSVQVATGDSGQLTVTAAGVPLAIGTLSQTLVSGTDSTGAATVSVAGSDASLSISGGDLGGLLSQQNGTLADFQNRLDILARQVATSFNDIQSTGVSASGGFTTLTSQNGVSSSTVPLSAAGLSFPSQSGVLFVGVTNTATGQRTISQVPIYPQSTSLQGVANAISSDVPNVSAFVNTQNGTLTISSATGYTFDFAGGYETNPTTNFPGGSTTTPTMGGTNTATGNKDYTFTFTSSGTIGVTPNLQAQVTNQSGKIVATINVGQGYTAGKPLDVANGITVSLAAGTAVSGDSFTSSIIGTPDKGGILNSLGLNTLFTGNNAASLSVSSSLTSNPGLIATSTTGQPGDTSNLQRFAALSDIPVLNNGTQSFSAYANQMVSDIGTTVQSLTTQQSTNQTLTTSINNQQQSFSGVDTNEELANVMKYQQQFEMAGKYISAVNSAVQTLITDL